MNRELRPTRSVQQLKDEQVNLMFEEIEKDIENIKLVISEKDKQLRDLKNTLFAAKAGYEKVTEENQQLKHRIVLIKENKKLRQQQSKIEEHKNLYYSKKATRPKNIKGLFTRKKLTVTVSLKKKKRHIHSLW